MSLTTLKSSQTLMNAALAGSLAALIAWAGPAGHRLPGARLPAPRVPPARLRALDELLVRRPLHVRRLQPDLLPARRARRDQAARRDQRRRLGGRVHARHPPDLGRVDASGSRASSRSSRRPRSSRPRSPTASGSPSRSRALVAVARRRIVLVRAARAAQRSRRARSRSSSCSSCSPPPASPARAARSSKPAIAAARSA